MNRGSCVTIAVVLDLYLASMRPRFMNRGSLPDRPRNRQCHQASMRPRFMNRGSSCGICNISTMVLRFNEAPIHESGKFQRWAVSDDEAARLQ